MEPKNTPLVGGKLVLTNLEKIMLKALEEADVAFAVFNITDLTPQARGCLVKTWPLVQDAIMEVRGKNSIYAEAAKNVPVKPTPPPGRVLGRDPRVKKG